MIEVTVIEVAGATRPSALTYRAEPSEGYECAVGPMEELAFGVAPEEPQLS